MENKLTEWGFHQSVCAELKRLKLDWDILKLFTIEDFKFIKINLSPGILTRLCKCIEQDKSEPVLSIDSISELSELPKHIFEGESSDEEGRDDENILAAHKVIPPKDVHNFSPEKRQPSGTSTRSKKRRYDEECSAESQQSIDSPSPSPSKRRQQVAVTLTVRTPHKASKPSSKAGHKKAEQPSKPGPSTESNQTTQSTEQPLADHARGPSSNIFHKAFRLNETNVCVEN